MKIIIIYNIFNKYKCTENHNIIVLKINIYMNQKIIK